MFKNIFLITQVSDVIQETLLGEYLRGGYLQLRQLTSKQDPVFADSTLDLSFGVDVCLQGYKENVVLQLLHYVERHFVPPHTNFGLLSGNKNHYKVT